MVSQRQRWWALCSHPGRQISCPHGAWIALNMFILHPKLLIQLESPVASFHMGDQLRSRPIPCVCTAHSPCRAPGLHTLGCSLTLQTWTLPGLGCCCPSPQSSHCELSTGRSMAGERTLCHQVQKRTKEQVRDLSQCAGTPSYQGFIPQKAKGLLSSA